MITYVSDDNINDIKMVRLMEMELDKPKMDQVADYINQTTGITTKLVIMEKEELKNIPFYILADYNIWKGKLFGRDVFILEKLTNEHFTPQQYKKQMDLLAEKLGGPVIFALPGIQAHDRNRLVQKQVNFILENKQLFIPQLLIDLKDYNVKQAQNTFLKPAAQVMILFHLQKQTLNGLKYKQVTELIGYPYLTISRAVENLATNNLCQTEGTKEKTLVFGIDKKSLWERALPFMKTPVRKKFYLNDPLPIELVKTASINALAHYTDLNDDGKQHLAIGYADFLELKKNGQINIISTYDGDFSIETWRYKPAKLSQTNYVDPLSLYIAFKDSKDERIEMQLENLLNGMEW